MKPLWICLYSLCFIVCVLFVLLISWFAGSWFEINK
jgi:hypothetical protein